jgi:hypothetical protein
MERPKVATATDRPQHPAGHNLSVGVQMSHLRLPFFLAAVLFASLASRAEEPVDDKKELQQRAAAKDIAAELEEPSGATIEIPPEGGFRIYGIGRGTYDFDDADDIEQARQEAVLLAKANIAKFMSETVTSEDVLAKLSIKMKKISGSGKEQAASAEKTDLKTTATLVRSSAKELLKGVIVLESSQKPNPSGTGGIITVKVGVSDKTVKVAGQGRAAIDAAGKTGSAQTAQQAQPTEGPGLNKPKKEKAKTDF